MSAKLRCYPCSLGEFLDKFLGAIKIFADILGMFYPKIKQYWQDWTELSML